jgi:hypothetical protein
MGKLTVVPLNPKWAIEQQYPNFLILLNRVIVCEIDREINLLGMT